MNSAIKPPAADIEDVCASVVKFDPFFVRFQEWNSGGECRDKR